MARPGVTIDATERWTEHRLVALAAALASPCPVRESFLFEPTHAFRVSCTESDTSLQRAIKRVFEHAGIACDAAVVLWKAAGGTARVERDGDTWFFEIEPVWKTSAEALGVIIAREAARALLRRAGISAGRTAVDDADLELVATLAGLGALLLAGPAAKIELAPALHPRLLRYAYVRVARSLDLGVRRAVDVLPHRALVVLLWPRVSRRPLPFRAIAPSVIIRCFCLRRLRVPTGAVGATTCPACQRKRPFDGRACPIESVSEPRALPSGSVPVASAWGRLGLAFLELPLAARVTAVLVVALIAIVVI